MAKRKRGSLSKKTRFDVFKRDAFSCQYCGATPPGALLHVDHVIPVADGGLDDIDNLITACADCNLGKGARSLSSIPQPLNEKAAEIAEREEQLRGYQDILEAKRDRIELEVDRVADIYTSFVDGFTLSVSARVSVKKFIEKLGVHECIEAMESAGNRITNNRELFRYFCGICWSKIRERS